MADSEVEVEEPQADQQVIEKGRDRTKGIGRMRRESYLYLA